MVLKARTCELPWIRLHGSVVFSGQFIDLTNVIAHQLCLIIIRYDLSVILVFDLLPLFFRHFIIFQEYISAWLLLQRRHYFLQFTLCISLVLLLYSVFYSKIRVEVISYNLSTIIIVKFLFWREKWLLWIILLIAVWSLF